MVLPTNAVRQQSNTTSLSQSHENGKRFNRHTTTATLDHQHLDAVVAAEQNFPNKTSNYTTTTAAVPTSNSTATAASKAIYNQLPNEGDNIFSTKRFHGKCMLITNIVHRADVLLF